MSNILNAIDQYLSFETDYAVLITGKWGTGKTYYVKQELFPFIQEKPTYNLPLKKYYPVCTSLFGVNSIQDLERKIFQELYPLLKKRAIKQSLNVGKLFTRAYLELNSLGDIDTYLKDLNIGAIPSSKYSSIVIFLDDIERKGSGLEIKELVGYVNFLANENNVKVVLISDYTKLDDDEKKDFEFFKEKALGTQVEYKFNFPEIYKSIVEKYFSGDKAYRQFLIDKFNIINGILSKADYNLRILIYFMKHFQIIFSELRIFQDEIKSSVPGIYHMLIDEENNIIEFSLAISIEFRLGFIDSDTYHLFIYRNSYRLMSNSDDKILTEKQKKELTYVESFGKKYFSKRHNFYTFYSTIYWHLIGNTKFTINKFLIDFKSLHNIQDDQQTPEYALLSKLRYPDVFNLSNGEYTSILNSLYQNAIEGKYNIELYPEIFNFLLDYNNICNYNPKDVVKNLKSGILLSQKSNLYNSSTVFTRLRNINKEYSDEINEIVDCIKEQEEKILSKENIDTLTVLWKKFLENPIGLNNMLQSNSEFNQYKYIPFFKTFDFKSLFKSIQSWDNAQLNNLNIFLIRRYDKEVGHVDSEILGDKNFWLPFADEINGYLDKQQNKSLMLYNYKRIANNINSLFHT